MGASGDELALFVYQCNRTGLDPFSRQIHFVKRWSARENKEIGIVQIGIDGYRALAERTGSYAGNDDAIFTYRADDKHTPIAATVAVWKMVQGQRCAFAATARWEEYYPGDSLGWKWQQSPHLMLAKCAEALALRKAFPLQLSGLYIAEEVEQIGPPIAVKKATKAKIPAEALDDPQSPSTKPSEKGEQPTNDFTGYFPQDCSSHGSWWSMLINEMKPHGLSLIHI